jgi:hypothetical protein
LKDELVAKEFCVKHYIAQKIEANEINEGVILDAEVRLLASSSAWRRISYNLLRAI